MMFDAGCYQGHFLKPPGGRLWVTLDDFAFLYGICGSKQSVTSFAPPLEVRRVSQKLHGANDGRLDVPPIRLDGGHRLFFQFARLRQETEILQQR
jgi:hypothetical protein